MFEAELTYFTAEALHAAKRVPAPTPLLWDSTPDSSFRNTPAMPASGGAAHPVAHRTCRSSCGQFSIDGTYGLPTRQSPSGAVARPARRLWPAKFSASSPAACPTRLTMSATALSESRSLPICPCRSTARNKGPAGSSKTSTQSRAARTGHVSRCDPNGMPTRLPALPGPSWIAALSPPSRRG
jgi:hypothetical protein